MLTVLYLSKIAGHRFNLEIIWLWNQNFSLEPFKTVPSICRIHTIPILMHQMLIFFIFDELLWCASPKESTVLLQAAFRKFYGIYSGLVCQYNLPSGQILSDMFHINHSSVRNTLMLLAMVRTVYLIWK
jgi:hypothetical protein